MARTGTCTDCHLRPIDRSVIGPELCTVCLDYADWENMHQDGSDGTDPNDVSHDNCPICHPELDTRYTKKTGHKNTATKGPHHSHAACTHAKTPAMRAECRATHTWSDDADRWVPNA
jgi:hypothetical protein